ncbi:MAG: BsuPI-related putative proteinase inhibitor, partial [Dehalococcoidia bacterium]|nr:BsuPI-related putative proteinase inhibitor [Dehalococcoidia bacterium]
MVGVDMGQRWTQALVAIVGKGLPFLGMGLLLSCARMPTPTPTPLPPSPTPTPTVHPAATPTPTPLPTPTATPTPPPLPGPTVSSPVQDGLRLTLSLSKSEYRLGEALEIRLTLTTTSPNEVIVTTPSSQLFDLVVRTKGGETRWSAGRAFLPVVTAHRIPPIGGLTQTLSWSTQEAGE